jgi:hypothetical protein
MGLEDMSCVSFVDGSMVRWFDGSTMILRDSRRQIFTPRYRSKVRALEFNSSFNTSLFSKSNRRDSKAANTTCPEAKVSQKLLALLGHDYRISIASEMLSDAKSISLEPGPGLELELVWPRAVCGCGSTIPIVAESMDWARAVSIAYRLSGWPCRCRGQSIIDLYTKLRI